VAYCISIFKLIANRASGRPAKVGSKFRTLQPDLRDIQMKDFIVNFLKDEEGLTMVEYAIAGALVAAVGAAVFTTLGQNVSSRISSLAVDVGT
jgi:pilus assembly protein Flp/PilA